MSLFSDILDKSPEEEIKDLKEEVYDLSEEVRELTTEIESTAKRAARQLELLQKTKKYIRILRNKLSDAEIEEAQAEFDESEKQAKVILEEEENI